MRPSGRRLADAGLGLLLACHPGPCLAVTAFATAYGAAINAGTGSGSGRLIGIPAAILSGQLCVGWSNDAIDGSRDLAAQRADKPISAGLVSQRVVATAAVLAAVACVVFSLRLGTTAGLLHLGAVISAVSYNAGLKSTLLSPLPYLISFGVLPVVVTFGVTGHGGTPPAHVAAGALLGAAAHFGNTVGDTQADAATGVRGLPQRLGPQLSLIVMAVLVAAAALVLLASVLFNGSVNGSVNGSINGSAVTGRRLLAGVLLLAGVVLAGVGAFRRVGVPGGRGAWRLTLVAVTLVIAGFLAAV